MAVTWADVTAIAPDLSSVAGGTQTAILADVATILSNADYWPSTAMHDLAKKYLAAHMGALYLRANGGGSAGGAGAITSETVGAVSVGYASPVADPSAGGGYETTFWGQQFLALSRRSKFRAGMVA